MAESRVVSVLCLVGFVATGACGEHGVSATGGASAASGAPATGGVSASGGASATGGASADAGASAKGGASANGGASTSGGAPASGAGTASGGSPSGIAGSNAAGGASAEAGAAGAPDADPDACVRAASGIAISEDPDPLGYARHALDGCRLAYVTPDGALMLRDLATGDEVVLDAAERVPRRPTLAAGFAAWEALIDGRSVVRVANDEGLRTLVGEYDHAGEPRASDHVVVFTAWLAEGPDADTDVLRYDTEDGSIAIVLDGPGQQRFADVSKEYVAISDFVEDPGGHYVETGSLSDIVVVERATGVVTRRSHPDKQAFPMLGSNGMLGYLEWKAVHPEPKFEGFDLMVGVIDAAPSDDVLVESISTDPRYVRPAAHGEFLDFIGFEGELPVLHRTSFLAPSEIDAVPLDGATRALGLVAESKLTLLGAATGAGAELRVVEH